MQIDSICDESMCPWMIISTRNNYDCHPKSSTPDSFWEDGLPGSLREPGRESLEEFRRVCLIQAQRSESLVPCQAFQLKKTLQCEFILCFGKLAHQKGYTFIPFQKGTWITSLKRLCAKDGTVSQRSTLVFLENITKKYLKKISGNKLMQKSASR